VNQAEIQGKVDGAKGLIDAAHAEMEKVIVGQAYLLDRLVMALICGQHVLLEGVPGLAKTLSVTCLARILDAQFKRIQFTPDLLPSDLLGTLIFHPKDGEFRVKKGPVFANIVLADEINRSPAKVQSALLEAMQERQVTLGDATHPLPKPFLVLATQNPMDQEGTYPLPEAQLDRFMMKIRLDYPDEAEELQILRRRSMRLPVDTIAACISLAQIEELRDLVDAVFVDPRLEQYMVRLVRTTRPATNAGWADGRYVSFGASPRAIINLNLAARSLALLRGRAFALPEDVQAVAADVLRHRIKLRYEALADGIDADALIASLLTFVPLP